MHSKPNEMQNIQMDVDFCSRNVGDTVGASLLESSPAVDRQAEHTPLSAKKLKHCGNDDERNSSEPLSYLRSLDAPQKFLQPRPLSSTKDYTHCNGKRKTSDGQNYSSSSSSPNNEDNNKNDDSRSRSPAIGNQVTKVVNVINEPEKVIDEHGNCGSKIHVLYSEPAATECPKACPITICYSRRRYKSQRWPFTKRSSIWKVFESMEVFKRVPQMPHFSPLRKLEENSREMLAICLMMNFSYVAEQISAGSPDNLNSSRIIHDTLKSVEELESHGFNITPLKDYLTKLLLKTEKEKELDANLEEIESGIIKCQDQKAAIKRKLSELTKQLKFLQEQIQLQKSLKYLKDRHLAILESHKGIISRKLHSSQLTMKPSFKW